MTRIITIALLLLTLSLTACAEVQLPDIQGTGHLIVLYSPAAAQGEVMISSDEPEAEVQQLEPQSISTQGYGVRFLYLLEPGGYDVWISAPGWATDIKHVTIAAKQVSALYFELTPVEELP